MCPGAIVWQRIDLCNSNIFLFDLLYFLMTAVEAEKVLGDQLSWCSFSTNKYPDFYEEIACYRWRLQ